MVDDALPLPGTTDAGENTQLAPAGSPLQASGTAVEKLPPIPVTVGVYEAVCPALRVTLAGEAAMEKSRPVPESIVLCCPPNGSSSVTVSDPLRGPAAVGVKLT